MTVQEVVERVCDSSLPVRERITLIGLLRVLRWTPRGRASVADICKATGMGDRQTREALHTLDVARIATRLGRPGESAEFEVDLSMLASRVASHRSSARATQARRAEPPAGIAAPPADSAEVTCDPPAEIAGPPAGNAGVSAFNAPACMGADARGVSSLDLDQELLRLPRVHARVEPPQPPQPPQQPQQPPSGLAGFRARPSVAPKLPSRESVAAAIAAADALAEDATPKAKLDALCAIWEAATCSPPSIGDVMRMERWLCNGPYRKALYGLRRAVEEALRAEGPVRINAALADRIAGSARRNEWDRTADDEPEPTPPATTRGGYTPNPNAGPDMRLPAYQVREPDEISRRKHDPEAARRHAAAFNRLLDETSDQEKHDDT